MFGKHHPTWAVRFAGAHTPRGNEFLPWPTRVPDLALEVPERFVVKAWRRPFDVVLLQLPILMLVVGPALLFVPQMRIKIAGGLLGALGTVLLAVVGSARFRADCSGLALSQPLSRVKLAWSDIAAIHCPEPTRLYRRRMDAQFYVIRVGLVLHNGRVVVPYVLQRRVRLDWIRGVEKGLADWVILDAMWRRYRLPTVVAPWRTEAGSGGSDAAATSA